MKLSVIIPVYNEEETVEEIIKRVKAVPINNMEIIVVNDCSSDRTPELLRSIPGIITISHKKNLGKGAAIRTGIDHSSGEIILIQDADLEYNPIDYPRLIQPFQHSNIDAVFGSRFKKKNRFLLHSRFANILLNFLTNALYGGKVSDMETGYKLIKKNIFKRISLTARGFDIEPEITCKLLRLRSKIYEVPINYQPRTKGKKITWKDGIIAFFSLVKYYVT